MIAPVEVALTAIGQALDAVAPREFAGKNDSPVTQLLGQAEIGLTVTRGTMSTDGQQNTLTIITPLNGTVRITGQIGNTAGKAVGGIGGAIGNLIGGNVVGKQIEDLAVKTLDQRTDFRGNVVVTSRPQLTPSWRLSPTSPAGSIWATPAPHCRRQGQSRQRDQGGARSNRQQPDYGAAIAAAQRSDDRAQRARAMGQDVPLDPARRRQYRAAAAMAGDAPRPRCRRAAAGRCPQCHGVQAETRILPNETKPNCPFPAQLDLVPPMQDGVLAVGVPIDTPFTELNRLIEPQLKGRHFPEDGSGPVDVEVLRASLAAAGDRLLISLRVKAREKKSWFKFGTEATVHIWGKLALDPQNQILRLTEISTRRRVRGCIRAAWHCRARGGRRQSRDRSQAICQ